MSCLARPFEFQTIFARPLRRVERGKEEGQGTSGVSLCRQNPVSGLGRPPYTCREERQIRDSCQKEAILATKATRRPTQKVYAHDRMKMVGSCSRLALDLAKIVAGALDPTQEVRPPVRATEREGATTRFMLS